MRHTRSWRFLLALAIVAGALGLFLLPAGAFARAGGGGNYSGGGGGDSGGGDSSGDGFIVYLLLRLCFEYPLVGIPALIVFIAIVYYSQRTGTRIYRGSVIRRGSSVAEQARRQQGLCALREEDPAFDENAFLQLIGGAFTRIQDAWSNQDLRPVRPFVSDAVFERFSLQFDEQRAFGYRNVVQNLRIDRLEIVQVELDEVFQQIAVRIDAAASDYHLPLRESGQASASPAPIEPFSEVWSFLRRRGARTKAGQPGLMSGNCPNCAAAIELNQNAQCAHCGALLRSGQYDWVLTEITQECEWQPRRLDRLPGVEELRQGDPGFNVQALEDLASVMFWRKLATDRLGTIDPLRKIATPGFNDRYASDLAASGVRLESDNVEVMQPSPAASAAHPWDFGNARSRLRSPLMRVGALPGGGRQFYAECGVGSVQTLGVMQDENLQRALVQITWSGTRFLLDGARQIHNTGQNGVSCLLLLLCRKTGTLTNIDRAISSAHCPNCGAPEASSASNACDFCGTVLNDGTRHWVLMAAMPSVSPGAAVLLAELRRQYPLPAQPSAAGAAAPTPPSPLAALTLDGAPRGLPLLAWMIKLALADGQVQPRERQLLAQVANRRKVPPDRLEAMIESAAEGRLDAPQPQTPDEARAWLGAMAATALADGQLQPPELSLLKSAATQVGLSDYDVKLLIAQTRRQLYTDARQTLRQQRRPQPAPSTDGH